MLSYSAKCFVCLCLFQHRHCFLVGWCTNRSYVIATSDLWLFLHASNLLPLLPNPLPYTNALSTLKILFYDNKNQQRNCKLPSDLLKCLTNTSNHSELRSCVKVKVDILGSPVPNSMYHLCACKATLKITTIIFLLDCLPGPAHSKFIELKIFKNAPLVNYILLECHIYITTAISEKWV